MSLVHLVCFSGLDAGPQPGGPNQFSDNGGNDGILAMGWGSGTADVCLTLFFYSGNQTNSARSSRTLFL